MIGRALHDPAVAIDAQILADLLTALVLVVNDEAVGTCVERDLREKQIGIGGGHKPTERLMTDHSYHKVRRFSRMQIVMDDGQQEEIKPGDFMVAAPGHDAWVVGDEACVLIDWEGYDNYAKRS